MNKILIYSTAGSIISFLDLFEKLVFKDFSVVLFSNNKEDVKKFKDKKIEAKENLKIFTFFSSNKFFLYIIFFPVNFFVSFILLLIIKFKYKINIIIFQSEAEKYLLSYIASKFKIKIYWLENYEDDVSKKNKFKIQLFKSFSCFAKIITVSEQQKKKVELLGVKSESIYVVKPGIVLNNYNHQENIFNKIAETENSNNKKFFTLGTVVDLDDKQKIEYIFQAVRKSLSVIPNLQFIVIGEGGERKNLAWLAKKMEIDNLVWFVGEQKHLHKWFSSFDLFIFANDCLSMNSVCVLLNALAAKLPIIGSQDMGLEDYFNNNLDMILVEGNNSELLAQNIIKLQQDRTRRLQLGKNGRELVEQEYDIEKIIENFAEIISD